MNAGRSRALFYNLKAYESFINLDAAIKHNVVNNFLKTGNLTLHPNIKKSIIISISQQISNHLMAVFHTHSLFPE